MNHFWSKIIKPIIESIDAKYIIEIGSDTGINTRNILEYCIENDARITVIDPLPNFDVDNFKTEYGDRFEIYEELSLSVLPLLENYDCVLIDGDHNWHTLYYELKIIEQSFKDKDFPIIFYENNPNNGGLTAIEDFMNGSEVEFSLELVNAFYGLGILFPCNQKLEHKIKDVLNNSNLLKQVGEDRIKFSIERQDIEKEQEIRISKLERRLDIIENKLDSKIELLQAKEFHINSLEEQLKKRTKQAIQNIDKFNKTNAKLKETNKKLIKTQNKLKYSNNKINKLTLQINKNNRFLEMQYLKDDNRSLRQKLISKFPSIFILLNFRKTGLKNALITVKGYRAIKKNNLFNIDYYLKDNPHITEKGVDPLLHYIYQGYKENRNPNSSFDTNYYMKTYPDVKVSGLNPLIHYSLYGIHEFRNTKDGLFTMNMGNV